MYIAPHRLFELESLMPPSFVRISKSVIANILQIESLHREIVGNGEITFRGCSKKTYFSRAYFKLLQYKIDEMRLKR
jgi:DNA-binding LytR/AlgR family response regulator